MLKNIALIVFFLFSTILANEKEENFFQTHEDLYDFRYKANFQLKKKNEFFAQLKKIFFDVPLEEEIKKLRIFQAQNKPVSNVYVLKERLDLDLQKMYQQIHYFGYYDANILTKISISKTNKKVTLIDFKIDLKKIFKLKLTVNVLGNDNFISSKKWKKQYHLLQNRASELTASMVDMKNIIDDLLYLLKSNGFYNPEIIKKNAVVNYKQNCVILNISINPKKRGVFVNSQIRSYKGIDNKFIKNRILWENGDAYDIRKVIATEENLRSTQLFSKIKIEPDIDNVVDDKVPMLIKVNEDKKRIINIGLMYSSMKNISFDESTDNKSVKNKSVKNKSEDKNSADNKNGLKSIALTASWENCNLLGGGEKLSFLIETFPMRIGKRRLDYVFETKFVTPDTLFKNNSVEYVYGRYQELTNVFFKKVEKISLMSNFPLFSNWNVSAGVAVEKNYCDGPSVFFNDNQKHDYKSTRIPLELINDTVDNILDPTCGYRLIFRLEHIMLNGLKINNMNYFNVNYTYNKSLDSMKKQLIAVRFNYKMLINGDIDNIPLDQRLYAGGVNSVRGFANRVASERILGKKAYMGGKSLLEFSIEGRRKFSDNIGGVLFFDAAKTFQNTSKIDELKTEKKRWFCSYGMGIRYFTPIGPVRLDIAFPMKRRKDIDSSYQLIISLGQAF